MADFRKAFSTGVEAAKLAAQNKREINSIITEVNDQLSEFYDGKVNFGVWNLSKRKKGKEGAGNLFLGMMSLETISYQGLCISNYEKKDPIELVEWKVTENGYPCIIKYEDREAYCYNSEDLMAEISSLLSDVKTGKAILAKLDDFAKKDNKVEGS